MTYFVAHERRSTRIRLHAPENKTIFEISRGPQGVAVRTLPARYKTTTQVFQGRVRGSLMGSLYNQVHSNWIASRFMDAYLLEYDLRKIPAGAAFSFKVEKKFDGPHFVGYGEILQTSLELDGTLVRKNFVRIHDGGVFVNAEDLLSDRPYYSPVGYMRIASVFQKGRRHPITRRLQSHLGIDFEAPEGTPIYAPKSGVVARMGRNRAAGNFLVLRHASGAETSYNHLRTLPSQLRIGQRIRLGQPLGEIGCTGYCTKAHLHFAVRKNGQMVDPAKYIKVFPAHFEVGLQRKVAQIDR